MLQNPTVFKQLSGVRFSYPRVRHNKTNVEKDTGVYHKDWHLKTVATYV